MESKSRTDTVDERSLQNILIIPDLHAPFIRNGYIEFVEKMLKKWNPVEVYQLGDLIDNHFASFHDTDPDGHAAGEELDKAIEQLNYLRNLVPSMKVCYGNHDKIPNRKAFSAGISKRWIKRIDDVLAFPKWEFADSWEVNGILLIHGIGMSAEARVRDLKQSVIQAHYHTKSYIRTPRHSKQGTFAMQLGTGMDGEAYAANYAKDGARMKCNLGVLIDGKHPIIEWMEE